VIEKGESRVVMWNGKSKGWLSLDLKAVLVAAWRLAKVAFLGKTVRRLFRGEE